jgi:hypothetical protein
MKIKTSKHASIFFAINILLNHIKNLAISFRKFDQILGIENLKI